MDKKILFCLNPAVSHFFPTIGLSKELIRQGYTILYTGFSNLENVVVSEGFEYISLTASTDKHLKDLKNNYHFRSLEKTYHKIFEELKEIIKSRCVDLVLFDISRFNLYFLPAFECKIPVISFWTCSGAFHINGDIPPNSSSHIPDKTLKSKIRVISIWIRRYVRREFCKPATLLSKFYFPYSDLSAIARKRGMKWKYNIDGPYLDVPKLVLGPREFEFSASTNNRNAAYLGLCVETRSDGTVMPDDFDPCKPLIYCSLGTLSHRYNRSGHFFNIVIETFTARPEWNAIINIGSTKEIDINSPSPSNILITDYAPQLEILKKADLVLTHGGYGTIKECIAFAVPMIVFPCIYDQPGNAARVEHKGIGVRRDIGKITRSDLEGLIESMLTDMTYKKNIASLKDRILLSQNGLQDGILLIRKELEQSDCHSRKTEVEM
ncbi:glycosyltransferase family 1 protein [Paenibacillus dendritiformis]|uniref:glycosyltransferase n=1 Tax=Paenibacillus dendritiformis TaxID=130049 RepID=UPI00143DEBA7|nr:glycosyltransferase [Paenibacillus dendritiformis]NKI20684.1 glycosyltransferase family 1 protein [Paenibacillus dendritiformis]NRF96570.1 glycosyltransferase family 1 protein [Paenibacillus dendritiformis]